MRTPNGQNVRNFVFERNYYIHHYHHVLLSISSIALSTALVSISLALRFVFDTLPKYTAAAINTTRHGGHS
jgi:hypothetical protein